MENGRFKRFLGTFVSAAILLSGLQIPVHGQNPSGESGMQSAVFSDINTDEIQVENVSAEYSRQDFLSAPFETMDNTVVWDCVYFGSYNYKDTNGDDIIDQNDEKLPVKWRVLSVSDNKVLLLSDEILFSAKYSYYYYQGLEYTYEKCTLRSYLNGYNAQNNIDELDYTDNNFISAAFTADEKEDIITTYIECSTGNNTRDKIFIPSEKEMTNAAYGFTDVSKTIIGRRTYWLRDKGERNNSVYSCSWEGIRDIGINNQWGVRPMIMIDSLSDNWTYAGTVASDGTTTNEKICLLTLSSNGGIIEKKRFVVKYGSDYEDINHTGVQRDGYDFIGWFTKPIGGDQVRASDSFVCTRPQTLYAHWQPKVYKVLFDPNGGTVSFSSKDICKDAVYGELPDAQRTGWRFLGWYDKAIGGEKVSNDTVFSKNENITVYAHWREMSTTLSAPRFISDAYVEWDSVYFGSYYMEDTNGDYSVDKDDDKVPIKWRVLSVSDNKLLLLADEPFFERIYSGIAYEDLSRVCTYEKSTLRSFLNSYDSSQNNSGLDFTDNGFISEAFTKGEQNDIFTTYLECNIGNNTRDKVYIPSLKDMENSSYGFNDRNKRKTGKTYWLRDMAAFNYQAIVCLYGGDISEQDYNVYEEHWVRPMITIDAASDKWTYAGIVSSDGKSWGSDDSNDIPTSSATEVPEALMPGVIYLTVPSKKKVSCVPGDEVIVRLDGFDRFEVKGKGGYYDEEYGKLVMTDKGSLKLIAYFGGKKNVVGAFKCVVPKMKNLKMKVGKSKTIKLKGFSRVYWTSDDEDVATVKNGVVTAHSPGSALITAYINGQSFSSCVSVY